MSALGSILLALTVLGTVASLCAIVPLVRRVRALESRVSIVSDKASAALETSGWRRVR